MPPPAIRTRKPVYYLARVLVYLLILLVWLVWVVQVLLLALDQALVVLDELCHRARLAVAHSKYVTPAWRDEWIPDQSSRDSAGSWDAQACFYAFLSGIKQGLHSLERLLDKTTASHSTQLSHSAPDRLFGPSTRESAPLTSSPTMRSRERRMSQKLSRSRLDHSPTAFSSTVPRPMKGPLFGSHRTVAQVLPTRDESDYPRINFSRH